MFLSNFKVFFCSWLILFPRILSSFYTSSFVLRFFTRSTLIPVAFSSFWNFSISRLRIYLISCISLLILSYSFFFSSLIFWFYASLYSYLSLSTSSFLLASCLKICFKALLSSYSDNSSSNWSSKCYPMTTFSYLRALWYSSTMFLRSKTPFSLSLGLLPCF